MDPQQLKYGTIYIAINPIAVFNESNLSEYLNPGFLNHHIKEYNTLLQNLRENFSFEFLPWEEISDTGYCQAMLIARRFNLGNLNKPATVQLNIDTDLSYSLSDSLIVALKRFIGIVTDVASDERGDRIVSLHDFIDPSIRFSISNEEACILDKEERMTKKSEKRFPLLLKKRQAKTGNKKRKKFSEIRERIGGLLEESDSNADIQFCTEASIDIDQLTIQEEKEICDIEIQEQDILKHINMLALEYALRFHKDPTPVIQQFIQGKLIINQDALSKLVINENTDIVLADYDETVVKMPALHRTIYMLFLKHLEDGIVLKCFGDLKSEIMDVYSTVMPNRDEELAQVTIKNLCDPMSNTLSEYISKINKRFRSVIKDRDIAEQYCIKGHRGEPYRIGLPPLLVQLPEWLN